MPRVLYVEPHRGRQLGRCNHLPGACMHWGDFHSRSPRLSARRQVPQRRLNLFLAETNSDVHCVLSDTVRTRFADTLVTYKVDIVGPTSEDSDGEAWRQDFMGSSKILVSKELLIELYMPFGSLLYIFPIRTIPS